MIHLRRSTPADFDRMRSQLFVNGDNERTTRSRFWVLLVLASVIAAAGVVADSTATVIGAMIVAPLMVPILGTALAVVTGDRANLFRSATLVVAGAAVAVAVGYLLGLLSVIDVAAATNTQVSARVAPRLIDLVAALATGTVGAFALCRPDVSDTMPGVAIAISLVPPLTVVGLTLESGATDEASGAALLFLVNVAAILVTACIVLFAFGAHHASGTATSAARDRRRSLQILAGFVLCVTVPLVIGSAHITRARSEEATIRAAAAAWAGPANWTVVSIERSGTTPVVTLRGPLPAPDLGDLRQRFDRAGLAHLDVRVELVPTTEVELSAYRAVPGPTWSLPSSDSLRGRAAGAHRLTVTARSVLAVQFALPVAIGSDGNRLVTSRPASTTRATAPSAAFSARSWPER